MAAIFDFDRVVVERSGRRVIDGVTGRIPDRGVTAIVGPSGSGKSTLLRLCNRLEMPASGIVRFRGRDVLELDPMGLRRQAGMVFQRPTPFPGTVRDNLLTALPEAGEGQMTTALGRAALDEAFLDRDATALSGGEAQRVCLARTLITGPEVLLMDEPTSALDATAGAVLERLACDLAEHGVPVAWVTHDRGQVERIASSAIELEAGRIVYQGPAEGLGKGGDGG